MIALAWSVVTPALVAQQRFEAAASAAAMEVRVDAGSGVERFSGPLIGGEGVVNAGRWTFALRLGDGSLTARTSGGVNRDVGELALEARGRAGPALAFFALARRCVYSTDFARQRWSTLHLGIEGRVPFVGGAVQAVARGALIPVVAVNGLPSAKTAYSLGTGLEYQRGAGTVRMLYSLERYEFSPQGIVRRSEQVATLTVRGAVRLGRRP